MKRRFFIFEILFFGGIIALSGFSAYQLILGGSSDDYYEKSANATDESNNSITLEETETTETTREISSTPNDPSRNGYEPIKTNCNKLIVQHETVAPRIRFIGKLCAPTETSNKKERKPGSIITINAEARNNSNHYEATVFDDQQSKTYSTDFIPLNLGKNEIVVDFFENQTNSRTKLQWTVVRKSE